MLAPLDVTVARLAATAVAAATRREVAEPPGDCGADTVRGAADPWDPTLGHPWNATTALASTNTIAARASSEPVVPKPAIYARVARIPISPVGRKPVELSDFLINGSGPR
jgi:hypothetical protein